MQNVTGQVARGEDFFDRKQETARFWDRLNTDNLLLLAPRRVGKTSVLRHMQTSAEDHGFSAIFLDVCDCPDELHFVRRLYSAVLEHHGSAEKLWNAVTQSWLGRVVSRVQKAGAAGFAIEFADVEKDWARQGEELAGALETLGSRTLIQIDELPVFVLKLLNRNDETEQGRIREFLYWLRRLRLEYPHVRWMLAGSIGLDTVAKRLHIGDAINDLRIEPLGAFTKEVAHELLRALATAYRVDLEASIREHVLERIGWLVPYYLQLVFDQLRDLSKPQAADVDEAIETLLNPAHRGVFDFWHQRLRDELGRPDADYACILLDAACRTPSGVSRSVLQQGMTKAIADAERREEKMRYLLDILLNDGYVVKHERVWRFRSPLLREYWLRHVAAPEPDDE